MIWGGRFEVLRVLVFCLFIYLYSGGGEFSRFEVLMVLVFCLFIYLYSGGGEFRL